MGDVCLSVCQLLHSERLYQALREAGYKWHSSWSCFHISFLKQNGIFRPVTLVAFLLTDCVWCPHQRELTAWEWKQVVQYVVLHSGVKWEHAEFSLIASCPSKTWCRYHVFLVAYAMLVIQGSSLNSYLWTRSSWFAGKIKDFEGLDTFVDVFLRVQLANSLLLWSTLIVLSHWCLVYLYSEPSHN